MKIDGWTLLLVAGVGALVVAGLGGGKPSAQEIPWRAEEVRVAACSLWQSGISPVELAPAIALAVYPEYFGEDAEPKSEAARRLYAEIEQYAGRVTTDASVCFSGEGP